MILLLIMEESEFCKSFSVVGEPKDAYIMKNYLILGHEPIESMDLFEIKLSTAQKCNSSLPDEVLLEAEVGAVNKDVDEENLVNQHVEEENADFSCGSSDNYVPSSEESDEEEDEEHLLDVSALSEIQLPDKSTSFTRKKRVNKTDWGTESRKSKRQRGKTYVTKKGKVVPERLPKPIQCSCKNKCTENHTEADRIIINNKYWAIADYEKQQIYLNTLITRTPCNRKLNRDSRRSHTLAYTLSDKIVCKKFFQATLNLSN